MKYVLVMSQGKKRSRGQDKYLQYLLQYLFGKHGFLNSITLARAFVSVIPGVVRDAKFEDGVDWLIGGNNTKERGKIPCFRYTHQSTVPGIDDECKVSIGIPLHVDLVLCFFQKGNSYAFRIVYWEESDGIEIAALYIYSIPYIYTIYNIGWRAFNPS